MDKLLLFAFVGIMTLNLISTFLYMVGLDQLRASVRRAYRERQKPR